MNNQFWGDERDFYKYALLRILAGDGDLAIGVCWMLTQCGKKGGGELAYLRRGAEQGKDPDLFDFLHNWICEKEIRNVENMNGKIIPGANFFPDKFPISESERKAYWDSCLRNFRGRDLIFLDPDTGILYGDKNAKVKKKLDEYIQRDEVRKIFNSGKHSLMVFQWFQLPFYNKEGNPTATVGFDKKIREYLSEIGGNEASVQMIWKHPVAYYFLIRKAHEKRILPCLDSAVAKLEFCRRD